MDLTPGAKGSNPQDQTNARDAVEALSALCSKSSNQEQLPDWKSLNSALAFEKALRRIGLRPDRREQAERLHQELSRLIPLVAAMPDPIEEWHRIVTELVSGTSPLLTQVQRRWRLRKEALLVVTVSLLVATAVFFWALESPSSPSSLILLIALGMVCASAVAAWAGWETAQHELFSWRWRIWLGPPAILTIAVAFLAVTGQRGTRLTVATLVASFTAAAVAGFVAWRAQPPSDTPWTSSLSLAEGAPGSIRLLLESLRDFAIAQAYKERRLALSWLITHIFVASIGAVGAAIAGAAAIGTTNKPDSILGLPPGLIAALALIGAGATALGAGLNPGHEWRAAQYRAKELDGLAREMEPMVTVDLQQYGEKSKEAREAVQYTLERLDTILGSPKETQYFWAMQGKPWEGLADATAEGTTAEDQAAKRE